MDKKVELFKQWIYVMAALLLIGMLLIYTERSSIQLLLCLIWMILLIIEVKYFNGKTEGAIYILWGIEYLVVLGICSREATGMGVLLALLIMGNIVLAVDLKNSLIATIIGYVAYVTVMRLSFGKIYDGYNIFMTTVNFLISYLLVFAIRYQILQRERVQRTAKELLEKSQELEKAYGKLQELYDVQEEMILLKERNRIAGEIHDTVGHRLTTAIVQLEASKRLMDKDREKSEEKLIIAQSQVREGLQDIRKAVKAMKDGQSILPFEERVKVFLEEVAKNNDIVIKNEIGSLEPLDSKIENVLFRGLQEGITNGLRHGKSPWFSVSIFCDNEKFNMTIQDRGAGCTAVNFGFGLHNMERRIKELKGTLQVLSKEGQGTTLKIGLPLKEINND